MKQKMIAICGLDCGSCEARIATMKNDDVLRAKVAKEWSELNGVEILPEMINCEGCRADGVKTVYCEKFCAIRQCALGKGKDTCADCSERAGCSVLAPIVENNGEARDNLNAFKERKND